MLVFCKRIYQTYIEGSRITTNIAGTTEIGPVQDVFVSNGQGPLCIDIEVSLSVHNTAWIRASRGVAQWARRSSEFAPNTEGMGTVFS